jgi:hypothetical protein
VKHRQGYKVDREQVTSQGIRSFLRARCGRGINYYKSVKGAGAEAKTVTNLLILLSVLGGRSNFIIVICIV